MHRFTYGPVPQEETENVLLKETKIGLVPEVWEVVIPKLPGNLLGRCWDSLQIRKDSLAISLA
jgi:hypothetical protein